MRKKAKADLKEELETVVEEKEGKKEEEVNEFSIENLPRIGPKGLQKLQEAGYTDLRDLARISPKELADACEITEATARNYILKAGEKTGIGNFRTAEEASERQKSKETITTGSKMLNELLGGGIKTQEITEAYGAFSSGKSQLGFQLAVNVQMPKEKGGLNSHCVFIDTEGTFNAERISQLAEARGLDTKKVLRNILVARALHSDHQVMLIDKVKELVKEKQIKLIIVDSLTALFRTDFTGRGELAPRQQKLNKHIHELQMLAEDYNLAVYVTNQVMSRPDIMFGDPTTHVGGHIVGHGTGVRMYLRKSKQSMRIARLIDSASLPEGEAVFKVTEKGVSD